MPPAVVVWALHSQVEPFGGREGSEVMSEVRANPGARHQIPAWTDDTMAALLDRLWAPDPADRPTFAEARHAIGAHFCTADLGGSPEEAYLTV